MRMWVDVCVRDHTSTQLCMHVLRSRPPGAQRIPHEGSMTALRDGLVHPPIMQSFTRKTADGQGSSSNVIILVYNWVHIYIYVMHTTFGSSVVGGVPLAGTRHGGVEQHAGRCFCPTCNDCWPASGHPARSPCFEVPRPLQAVRVKREPVHTALL